MKFKSSFVLLAVIIGFTVSCSKKVTRVDSASTIDLSGRWNDTDSRLVAGAIIEDCLGAQWLYKYKEAKTNPRIIIGRVENKSREHISVETFIKDMERVLLNSGKVDFVAEKSQREQLRDEVDDMGENASGATAKTRGEEEGANLMLLGSLNTIIDKEGGKKVVFYQIDLELIELETNQKKWLGSKKIKKYVKG